MPTNEESKALHSLRRSAAMPRRTQKGIRAKKKPTTRMSTPTMTDFMFSAFGKMLDSRPCRSCYPTKDRRIPFQQGARTSREIRTTRRWPLSGSGGADHDLEQQLDPPHQRMTVTGWHVYDCPALSRLALQRGAGRRTSNPCPSNDSATPRNFRTRRSRAERSRRPIPGWRSRARRCR